MQLFNKHTCKFYSLRIIILLVIKFRVSLCSSGWQQTHEAQPSSSFYSNPLASAAQIVKLQLSTITLCVPTLTLPTGNEPCFGRKKMMMSCKGVGAWHHEESL